MKTCSTIRPKSRPIKSDIYAFSRTRLQRDGNTVLKEIKPGEKAEAGIFATKFSSSVSYTLAEMKIVFREETAPAECCSLLPN